MMKSVSQRQNISADNTSELTRILDRHPFAACMAVHLTAMIGAFVPVGAPGSRGTPFGLPRTCARPASFMMRAGKKSSRKAKKDGRATKSSGPGVSNTEYAGPRAPDFDSGSDGAGVEVDVVESVGDVESIGDADRAVEGVIPVADESTFKLPDMPIAVKRKRKKKASDVKTQSTGEKVDVGADTDQDEARGQRQSKIQPPVTSDSIAKLTAAYRVGGDGAKDLISEIEKDPDYMFQTGNFEGEYDLTSAIIGTGKPNKEGLFLLPYLQSGHMLLLLILLLCTFVYYPGFPLTEADEGVRVLLKRGLALTYVINAGLAVLAYSDAKKRAQPPLFWAFKVAFLGNIAYNELRRNAPLEQDRKKGKKKRGKGKEGGV